jgi:hypothetical protein
MGQYRLGFFVRKRRVVAQDVVQNVLVDLVRRLDRRFPPVKTRLPSGFKRIGRLPCGLEEAIQHLLGFLACEPRMVPQD